VRPDEWWLQGAGADALESVQLILNAVRQAKVRAIVQGWDEAISALDPPPTVHHVGSVLHSWLFKHVNCVVHHGGFGTTAATLRAGVPAVVIPHIISKREVFHPVTPCTTSRICSLL